jgi:putative ABC transport system ATP-binding protein
MTAPMIEVHDVTKTYGTLRPVHALRGINLSIEPGEYVAIMGPSGSGKSTLMNILGCLDRPTSGRYVLRDQDVSTMTDDQLAVVRNQLIGFVFQTFNLLPRQTALDNVQLPLIYRGVPPAERRKHALDVLARVGLDQWSHHRPNQMSGGQQQRVAIARALAADPSFLLADEPTGNLDSISGQGVMVLVEQLNSDGMTVVVVTHDERIAAHSRRQIRLLDGLVVHDEPNLSPLSATAEMERLRQQLRDSDVAAEEEVRA